MADQADIHAIPDLMIDDGDAIRLVGSRCQNCGSPFFPAVSRCANPDCDNSSIVGARFGGQGTLWSYARQNYAPPDPVLRDEPFVPYVLGLVDLDDGLRIFGRIDTDDETQLEVNARVEIVSGHLGTDEAGAPRIGWKFRPLNGRGRK
jgi:hypothetical protein